MGFLSFANSKSCSGMEVLELDNDRIFFYFNGNFSFHIFLNKIELKWKIFNFILS